MSKKITTPGGKEIELTDKFNKWSEYYLDRNSPNTYLNATQSAVRAYPTATYNSCRNIGAQNVAKLHNARQAIADELGYDLTGMMKLGFKKVERGDYNAWRDMMVLLGHAPDPKSMNQTNVQVNVDLGEAIEASRNDRGLDP